MEGEEGEVRRLIERATDSTDPDVDPRLLKAIKSAVRSSNGEVAAAVDVLMEKMKKEHSQVRYLAVLIIDELFMRSKLFRSLFVTNFDHYLSLSVGFRRGQPLPPPTKVASLLRTKSIEFLEKWNISFGFHYRQIRLGFNYLKDVLRFQFPNRLENQARLQREAREREMRTKEILVKKFENLKSNFSTIKGEVQSTLDEMRQCLDIVRIRRDGPSDFIGSGEHDEAELIRCPELQHIREASLKESEKVHENNDNKAIFDVLRDSYKILISRHLVSVQDWMSVLVRVDLDDNRFRDSALKEFIDIRKSLLSVKNECDELGFSINTSGLADEEDDDIIWEEGKIEVQDQESKDGNLVKGKGKATNIEQVKESRNSALVTGKGKAIDCEEATSESEALRSKLLAEAPVMTWGSCLDSWGSTQRDVMANHRGLEVEGHWGRVDYDAVIPAEKIAELNVLASVYKEKPADVRPCLAPLKNGGLCQRRDLKVCPFHGPIVPRDPEGNAMSMNKKAAGEGSSSNEELVRRLTKQAVKNVREREKEEHDMVRSLKKAKLARVREHNEAVLREAALASTVRSQGVGGGEEHVIKAKKPTLASMLRKKVMVKDRLSKKLLNARVTEAAVRQLSQGEEASYREAYPNQW
ncbi:hypothetical protein QJS04_geneDACA012791 [Acorus gramineus]|uniref:UV-stimulated scaffold protein A C-terminal domain-containing protein n=1 Tax=Acorus gramineus TaxID=55184 RepID=A0AAV9BG15_ACOGR|nr:hypothetical protein QJS04_geneDACA012791 [Acorus gramineus]